MKCLYCSKPIDGSKEAFVTIPNPEQCGYQSRRPTKFVHATCYEQETVRMSEVLTQLKALAVQIEASKFLIVPPGVKAAINKAEGR